MGTFNLNPPEMLNNPDVVERLTHDREEKRGEEREYDEILSKMMTDVAKVERKKSKVSDEIASLTSTIALYEDPTPVSTGTASESKQASRPRKKRRSSKKRKRTPSGYPRKVVLEALGEAGRFLHATELKADSVVRIKEDFPHNPELSISQSTIATVLRVLRQDGEVVKATYGNHKRHSFYGMRSLLVQDSNGTARFVRPEHAPAPGSRFGVVGFLNPVFELKYLREPLPHAPLTNGDLQLVRDLLPADMTQ